MGDALTPQTANAPQGAAPTPTKQAPGSREATVGRLRTMSYAEGAAAVSPRVQLEPAAANATDTAARTAATSPATRRVVLDGLTSVIATSPKGGRAVIVLPAGIDETKPIDIMVFLHGQNESYNGGADQGPDYRMADQLVASGRNIIGILPQGNAGSVFRPGFTNLAAKDGMVPGRDNPLAGDPTINKSYTAKPKLVAQKNSGLDVGALQTEVLTLLVAQKALSKIPAVSGTMLAAHSAGGEAAGLILGGAGAGKLPTNRLKSVVLFDAINSGSERSPEELIRIVEWLKSTLSQEQSSLQSLVDPADTEAGATQKKQLGYLQEQGSRFRIVTTSKSPRGGLGNPNYNRPHDTVAAWLETYFADQKALGKLDDSVLTRWRQNYAIVYVNEGKSVGAPAPGASSEKIIQHGNIVGARSDLTDAIKDMPK